MMLKNKIFIFFTIICFCISNTYAIEIWEKKNPPSIYLENLATKERNVHRWVQGGLGYIVFGFGALITMGSDHSEQVLPFDGKGIAALGIGTGLYLMIPAIKNTMPATYTENIYNEINAITDNNEKEKRAYEALVELAATSIKFKNDRNDQIIKRNILAKFFFTVNNRKINGEVYQTPQQKALNDFLNQRPLN